MLPYLFGVFIFLQDRRIIGSLFSLCGFRRQYGFLLHLFPSWFVLVRIVHRVLMLHRFGHRSHPVSLFHHQRYRWVSDSVLCRFWTIFGLPFSMSRIILSHRPYFLSSPQREYRCFGVISTLIMIIYLRLFFAV